jgi:uncharacterized RDD family membrane protein YckC/Tfp pilus assembly major pilin PilA
MNDAGSAAVDRAAYAGFWRRFAAYAIDYVLVLLGSAVLGAIATSTGLVDPGAQARLTLLALAGYFLYCTLLESSAWQATVGKRVLGLKVANARGERIGMGRAAARFAAKLLSVLTMFLGYLLIALTRRRQALHDLLAGTLVVFDDTLRRPVWVVALLSTAACVPFLGVLAAIALPAYQDYTTRAQVSEGLALASRYREAIETTWRNAPRDFTELTSDTVGTALPRSGRYVESIEVVSGTIVITYGAAANADVAGRVLAIVPALDARRALAWACGYGPAPAGFAPALDGHPRDTDIDERHLPTACRSISP